MCRRRTRTQSEWNVEISGRGGASFAGLGSAFRATRPRAQLRQQRRGPLLHFAGRLLGERDGQNALGLRAAADQLGDAIGDDARLAGARAGQHQQRPSQRAHRVELGRVQIGRHRNVHFPRCRSSRVELAVARRGRPSNLPPAARMLASRP